VRQIGRREAAAAPNESETRHRALAELSSDWYWTLEASLHLAEVTGNVEAATGLAASAPGPDALGTAVAEPSARPTGSASAPCSAGGRRSATSRSGVPT
jgi:hypothetical protein